MKKLAFNFILMWMFTIMHNNSFGQNVGIGTLTPGGKLHIKGSENITQLWISGNFQQTNFSPLIKLTDSDGTNLMWIHSDHPMNTFIGVNTGRVNNAVGGGTSNTFIGSDAGFSNTIGFYNTSTGDGAMYSNSKGNNNVANGKWALGLNTTASQNVAIGRSALFNQSYSNSGTVYISNNVAVGFLALGENQPTSTTTGIQNNALGTNALGLNATGSNNSAHGFQALYTNTTGNHNTAFGNYADVLSGNLTNATAIGYNAKVATSNTIILGGTGSESVNVGIGTTYTNSQLHLNNLSNIGPQITLSAPGGGTPGIAFRPYQGSADWVTAPQALITATDNNYSANINFSTKIQGAIGNGLEQRMIIQNDGNVGIGITNPSDKLVIFNGTTTGTYANTGWMHSSDSRLKTNIKPLESSLNKILHLQGVSYNWNATPIANNQIGFIAQDVEKVFPEVITIDKDGNYSMAPQNLTAPIIEAIKEQQEQIKSKDEAIKNLQSIVKSLQFTVRSIQNENTELIARLDKFEFALSNIMQFEIMTMENSLLTKNK